MVIHIAFSFPGLLQQRVTAVTHANKPWLSLPVVLLLNWYRAQTFVLASIHHTVLSSEHLPFHLLLNSQNSPSYILSMARYFYVIFLDLTPSFLGHHLSFLYCLQLLKSSYGFQILYIFSNHSSTSVDLQVKNLHDILSICICLLGTICFWVDLLYLVT